MYSTEDICKVADVSQRQVRYWTNTGLLKELRKKSKRHKFEEREMMIAQIISAMLSSGFSTQESRGIINRLRTTGRELHGQTFVMLNRDDFALFDGDMLTSSALLVKIKPELP